MKLPRLVVTLGSHRPREGHKALLATFGEGVAYGKHSMVGFLLAPDLSSGPVSPML